MLDKTKVRRMIKKAIKRFNQGKITVVYSMRKADGGGQATAWLFGDALLAACSPNGDNCTIFGRAVASWEYLRFTAWLASLTPGNEGIPQVANGQLVKFS